MLFKFLMLLAVSALGLVVPMTAVIAVLAVPVFMLILVAGIAIAALCFGDQKRREDARAVLQMLLEHFFQKR